jgi:secondary thiamine-phosphate synthase enzyme
MAWYQKEILLGPKKRGFHLVTEEIVGYIPEIRRIKTGIVHIFIKHTSASISLNENADRTVRTDMETYFNKMIPENMPYYEHNTEGSDDMPSHLKSVIIGSSVSIPVTNGIINMGTWQGIYLCEHRNYGSPRKIVITIMGEE